MSVNSYWENIYEYQDDPNLLENKLNIIFKYFMHKSAQQLNIYLSTFENCFANPNEIQLTLSQEKIKRIKKVNSFFQSDQFRGFILKTFMNYEAYFVPTRNTELIKISNLKDIPEPVLGKANLLLKSMIKIEISSDYDAKERRFNNYAAILDLNSNPSLLILLDPINEPLKFKISWIDSNGKL